MYRDWRWSGPGPPLLFRVAIAVLFLLARSEDVFGAVLGERSLLFGRKPLLILRLVAALGSLNKGDLCHKRPLTRTSGRGEDRD